MSRISLSDWAKVAEIGAATGVIISLTFVGLEIQSNTAATEAATRESVLQVTMEFLSLRIDSSLLAKAHTRVRNGEELSPDEQYQLEHEAYINFIGFAHSHYQYQQGFLDSDAWLRRKNVIRVVINGYPHNRIMWEGRRQMFEPEFQELVNNLMSD